MNNSTSLQENESLIHSPGFMAFSILLTVVTVVAGLMIGFTIVALFKANSVPTPVRLYLINLLFAGLIVALTAIFILITSAVLVLVSSNNPRPLYLCRVYLWLFATGAVTRLWSLAAFSLSTMAIVLFSKKTINKWSAVVIVFSLWIAPMLLSLYILFPNVYEVQFIDSVACYPDNNHKNLVVPARYTFAATWTIFGGLTPLTVSIIVPIVCLCYIRKNIVTEGTNYRKGLAKFSLFLIVGGSINFFGQFAPSLSFLFNAAPGVYLSYGSAAISLLPTPIIIVAFLKPVREQAQRLLPCGQLSKRRIEPKSATTTYSDYNSTTHVWMYVYMQYICLATCTLTALYASMTCVA